MLADTKREKAVQKTIWRLLGAADMVKAQSQTAADMEDCNELLIRWAGYLGAANILEGVKDGTPEQIANGVKLAKKYLRQIQHRLCDDGNSPFVRALHYHFKAFD